MEGGRGHEGTTFEVFYHKPHAFYDQSPILIVLPGDGRNGDDYRDAWVEASEQYNVLVLSPAYPEKDYDMGAYHFGGVIGNIQLGDVQIEDTDGGGQVYRLNDRDVRFQVNSDSRSWLFHDFDRLFETVTKSVGSSQTGYDMFGHSAGGQVLQRLVLFQPGSKAKRILASNAGFYTLPSFETTLPFGIKGTTVTRQSVRRSLAEPLVLFLGELDNERETRGIALRSPQADLQGLGRAQRGRYFYTLGKRLATDLGTTFNWRLEVIPTVGHDPQQMAAAAASYLYER